MSNPVNPSPNPALDTPSAPAPRNTSTALVIEDATATVGQEQQGEEQALESHEVIELQTFSERKAWIEEKIRFLENMPPVEVFVGLDSIRLSAEVVPELPTRAELDRWMTEHDAIEKETEIFDTGELTKLRQLTKAATQRNLSPEDTDVIELTLTTIYTLDKLLHLLRDRSENFELLGIRLVWEEHRSAAWVERRQIIGDLTQFIMKRARWNTSVYESTIKDDTLRRRGSVNSFASGGSDTSINSSAFSRSARFKLAELLSRDAAQFGSRVTTLRHGKIASAGKALDKLIDHSRKPVPEELLDEQDRLEEQGINEMERIGKFAMNLVMQWRKADEIYVETSKDQMAAQNLLEEIETAKLHHPTHRQSTSFVSRADALFKRLSVRVNPITNPHFFPYPTHPLFEDQKRFNEELAHTLASEIQTATDLANRVNNSAKQYQTMFEAVKRLDTALEDAIDISADLKAYLKQMDVGVSNKDGDGSPPDLSSERCLDTTRHAVFLALWPSVSDNVMQAVKRTDVTLPEIQILLAQFDAAGVKDPEYRREVLVKTQQLQALKGMAKAAHQRISAKLDQLREVRKITSSVDGIQQRLKDLRHQVAEAMERTRWRQDSLDGDLPLTPESPPSCIGSVNIPSLGFLEQLAGIGLTIADEVSIPYTPLSQHLETTLKDYFTRVFTMLHSSSTTCEESIRILAALQQQASVMVSTREECHALQLRIEDMKIRCGTIVGTIITDTIVHGHTEDSVAEFHHEADSIQANVKTFVEGLVSRIPFVSRHGPPPLAGGSGSRQRSMSSDLCTTLIGAHETQFDLLSVDAAVRADCNSFAMRLGGEVEGLIKCKHHLTLARLSKDLDYELASTIDQIYDAAQHLNGWKSRSDQFTTDMNLLELLNDLLKVVEEYSTLNQRSIKQRFPLHRELLRKMETSSTTLDQPIRETLYIARIRAVDDAELRFNTWAENLALFKNELDQAIRSELFRIDERKRVEEQRQREEAERKATEEEDRRRREEGRRLKEEAEKEEAARLAEKTRVQSEKQRLEKVEAERLRLERERAETEKRALAEKQAAEVERLRLEQQFNASIEAQRLQSQRERDKLELRLWQLEEELTSIKRLKQEQNKAAAEETARTVSEMEKQRRQLEELLDEYRRKLETLKNSEDKASKISKTPGIQTTTDLGQDVFTLEISPIASVPRTQEIIELEARIQALRKRLNSLGLKSSVNLPIKHQVQRMQDELATIVTESSTLPSGIEDGSLNVVLRSFRADLDAAFDHIQQLAKLADLNSSFQDCDAALSDLLEHIDSYPTLPTTTMSSFSASQLASPEDQLSARLKFTTDGISFMEELTRPFISDKRVMIEHSRIMQTWSELVEMASDRISGKKSRPGSVISSRESSGRDSSASVHTTTTKSTHKKKASYNSLSIRSKGSQPSRGRLLAPPQPTSQRRVVSGGTESGTPRSSSRMSTTSIRSVSGGSFSPSLYQPTFSSRQRTTSLSSSTNLGTPIAAKGTPNPHSHTRSKGGQNNRSGSPAMSEASFTRPSMRPSAASTRSSVSNTSTWARAPRNSLSSFLPRATTPQRKDRPSTRKKYVPNPKSKLDVAVGDVVNNLPVGINVEGLTETWKDQSGKYWIGNQDPKLCFCRILRSQTVMVRVGGGWTELSKFIKDHFADSFRLLSESPPRPGGQEEKWISSTTLLESAAEPVPKSPPPAPPKTPEPKNPFVPSFLLLTPTGQSPRSMASSPSTKGSPLTPLQFIRRADPDATLLRPVTPTKQSRSNTHAPLRLWRP